MEHRFVDEALFLQWVRSGLIVDAASVAAYSLLGLHR